MLSLSCDHPDLEDFISVKTDLNKVTKANISVRITDKFMEAVRDNKPYELTFTRKETGETIKKVVDAKKVFTKMAEINWNYAEPGMLFWDNITDYNLLNTTPDFEYAGTNPCAEEPLPAGGSCLLGSINLAEFVTKDKRINYTELFDTVCTAVKALNDVLQEGLPLHPLKEQRESVNDWRQIGLGIMGLADMLIKLEIPYGSQDSLKVCDAVGRCIAEYAMFASSMITKEHGSFPKFNLENVLSSSFMQNHADHDLIESVKANGMANSQLLTIAPTGSLSTMIGVSGGIEPIFANYYTRKTESLHGEDTYYKVYTPIVDKYMKQHNLKDDSELPDWFVTSKDIHYKNRIEMQSVWQKHIDASISSTVNVPNEFTVEEVADLYMYAWENNLKGITIYRDGCARSGILTTDSTKKADEPEEAPVVEDNKPNLDENQLIGFKRKLITGCGSLHLCAFFDQQGRLVETYFSKGSSGGCLNFMTGLSRMVTLAAKNGVSIYDIVDQLKSSGTCPSYAVRRATKHDTSVGSCCPVALANALMEIYNSFNKDKKEAPKKETPKQEFKKSEKPIKSEEVPEDKCPECGATLRHEMGCKSCPSCGWSKCA